MAKPIMSIEEQVRRAREKAEAEPKKEGPVHPENIELTLRTPSGRNGSAWPSTGDTKRAI